MTEYMAIWPIDDKHLSTADLALEATPLLYELLEQAALAATGHIAWSRDYLQLVATVPVVPLEAAAGDLRPWMSRNNWIDEMADGRAA
jgi:hypothetical protein